MSPRLTDWLINAALLVGSVIIGLGGAELILRATGMDRGRPRTPPIYQQSADPEISYELKPNVDEAAFRSTVRTNSLGFRSPEIDPTKPSIALLGDSIAFGYGVENHEALGSRLADVLMNRYNVMNAAVPGYNLRQEIATYRSKIAQLNPETLILVFYWNDLQDMTNAVLDDEGILRQPGWQPEAPKCNPIATGILGLLPGRCWLDLHSATYRVIKKVALARQEQANLKAQREEFRANPEQDSVKPEHLQAYRELFIKFTTQLPADQRKFFVIWPDKELHAKTVPILAAMAAEGGFTLINLYDTFGNEAETLSWDTVHPSAETVRKAAEIIGEKIREAADTPTAAR